jgi:tetratricopeptide (TPR) repeat protein
MQKLADSPSNGCGPLGGSLFFKKHKMSKDDWYRNTIWTKEIEEAFESRLKRSRGNFHKAQYLRIQASYLIDSPHKPSQEKGVELMHRLFSSYPEEIFETISGREQLADHYFKNGSYLKAESLYRIVTNHSYDHNRSGTTGIADLKLCETLLASNQVEKFEEAYEMATVLFFETKGYLQLNSEKFYYANLMANLCYRMNKKSEAFKYAENALQLSKIKTPQFSRHKSVGLINPSKEDLKRLRKIQNKSQNLKSGILSKIWSKVFTRR